MPRERGAGLPVDALADAVGAERLERNVPLAPYTTFRIGGPADVFYRARTPGELTAAVTAARALEVPYFLLGTGANVLVADAGFRGLVIRSEVGGVDFLDGARVRAGAGVRMYRELIPATLRQALGGLHHFVGIPSSVGGAVWQNLHFLSPDRSRMVYLAEVLESAKVLVDGDVRTVGRDYFRFGYDYSILHDRDDVLLAATFALEPAAEADLRRVVRENLAWRDERHPDLWLYPCAGSIFRKIEGVGAGRLIDECGLKGRLHGNAQIFHKHANIIVNLGGATAADVRALIDLARDAVQHRFGYELVPEIVFVGQV